MKRGTLLTIFLLLLMLEGCKPALLKEGEKATLWEGFEETMEWKAIRDDWGTPDGSLLISQTDKFASEEKMGAKCDMKLEGESIDATYVNESRIFTDWSDYKGVGIDIYKPMEEEITVAFAICTGPSWLWHESLELPLKKGWNYNVRFDLVGTLKSQLTEWEHTASLAEGDDVKRLVIKFFGKEEAEGFMVVDNIRIIE